ncbi:MAG: glycosyltransferase family 4 protein [Cyanobacteria bacterium P01_D01_bin.105]
MNYPKNSIAEGTYKLSCLVAERQYKMATFWQHKGSIDRAITTYRQAIQSQPNYIPGYLSLAPLMYQQQRYDEAILICRQALALGATEPWIASYIEDSLIGKGEFADCDLQSMSSIASQSQAVLKVISDSAESDSVNDKRRHILLYTNCPGTYGAEQISHLLMCHLVTQGYRITCVQSKAKNNLIESREAIGIEHIWLEGDARQFLYSVTNTLEAIQIFKQARPHLIIFADGEPMANIGASQAAKRLGIPFIKIVHCVNVNWAEKFSAYLHLLPPIYQAATAVISVSQANLTLMHDLYYLPEQIGRVIYNSCADLYFTPRNLEIRQEIRQSLKIPEDAIVVFTAARLVSSKGYQHQLTAIKTLKHSHVWGNLYFLWAGSGCEETELERQIEALEVTDYVRMLGHRSDVDDLLDAADIFVLPSHFEGMPVSILEAMAKGCAVAATKISGIPEMLGNTGKLLSDPNVNPEQTAQELADTLIEWAKKHSSRKSSAEACRQRAHLLFQQKNMIDAYAELIEAILIQD